MVTPISNHHTHFVLRLQILTKMARYVLHRIAVAGGWVHAEGGLFDPDATNDPALVRLDQVEKFGPEPLSLPALVPRVTAGHLQDLAALHLNQNMIKCATGVESTWKVPSLELQEVASQSWNGSRIEDHAEQHHDGRG